jgi:hypothetical protein
MIGLLKQEHKSSAWIYQLVRVVAWRCTSNYHHYLVCRATHTPGMVSRGHCPGHTDDINNRSTSTALGENRQRPGNDINIYSTSSAMRDDSQTREEPEHPVSGTNTLPGEPCLKQWYSSKNVFPFVTFKPHHLFTATSNSMNKEVLAYVLSQQSVQVGGNVFVLVFGLGLDSAHRSGIPAFKLQNHTR